MSTPNSSPALQEFQREAAALKAQIDSKNKELSDNKTELETKKRQIADLQKQIKDLETNTHGIENHLRTLKAQMAQHDQAMRMAQQEFAKLNSTKK